MNIANEKITCLNCGYEQTRGVIREDNLGTFTVCEKCNSSFDLDIVDCLEKSMMEQLIEKVECDVDDFYDIIFEKYNLKTGDITSFEVLAKDNFIEGVALWIVRNR